MCHNSLFQLTSSLIAPFRKAQTLQNFLTFVFIVFPEAGKGNFKVNGKLRYPETAATPKVTQEICGVADQALKGHTQVP